MGEYISSLDIGLNGSSSDITIIVIVGVNCQIIEIDYTINNKNKHYKRNVSIQNISPMNSKIRPLPYNEKMLKNKKIRFLSCNEV